MRVAEQAIKNLEARKDKSTGKPSAIKSTNKKEESVVEQPKKHQHPILQKGKSAYAGKGKASAPSTSTAPAPTPEVVVTPPEPRRDPSPRPVAKIQPELSSEKQQSKSPEQLELPTPISIEQVRADLALSASSDEEYFVDAYVIDTDAEDERTPVDPLTDVEPEDTPEEIAAREKLTAEQPPPAITAMIPEIVAEFQETVVISDDPEPIIEAEPPTTDAGPLPSASTTTAVPVDVTARKLTRPMKPYTPVQFRTTLSQPQPIPRQPEAVQQAKRRTKTVSSLHMANATVNYHKSTDQLTEEFATRYSLKPEEHYNIRREMRKMRLAQKMLMLRFRSMFPANVRTEADRERFVNWFEEESRLVANRNSDSDDSVVELGVDRP